MTKNKNYPLANSTMTTRRYEPVPPKISKKERIAKNVRRTVAAVGLAAIVGTGAAAVSKGHSGPKHNQSTEAAIESVIKPEMRKIALAAKDLADKPDSIVFSRQADTPMIDKTTGVKINVTEISGISSKDSSSIKVAVGDYPGTKTPNFDNVLATDIVSDPTPVGADPTKGTFHMSQSVYTAPGGDQYLAAELASNPYPVDKDGWTAIDYWGTSVDGVDRVEGGNAFDTASAEYYGPHGGPVGTAESTIPDADNTLDTVRQSFSG